MKNLNRNPIKEAVYESFWYSLYNTIVLILYRVALLLIPITASKIVTSISNNDYNEAYKYVIITALVVIFQYIIGIVSEHSWYSVYNSIIKSLSKKAIEKTFDNSSYSLSRFNFSKFNNIMIDDISTISSYFAWFASRIIVILEFIYIVVYFFSLNVIIGSITLVVIIILILINAFGLSNMMSKANLNRTLTLDSKISNLENIYFGIDNIKNYNMVDESSKRYVDAVNKASKAEAKAYVISISISEGSALIIQILRYLVYMYAIYLISIGQMELGIILIIYDYFSKIIDNITSVATFINKTNRLNVHINRYNSIFVYAKNSSKQNNKIFKVGDITFNNIVYGDKVRPKLKNISFTIKQNKLTAIKGTADSGIEGIFELLIRLNQQHKGNIKINTVNINNYPLSLYASHVDLISRNPIFFNATIKENLLLIDNNFDEIKKICKLLDIDKDIEALEDGYDTVIEYDCSNISLRLKYLLEFARVFLHDPDIILIDDIFDIVEKTELKKLLKLLDGMKEYKTIILKTRNNEIIKFVDEVIVCDDGVVIEHIIKA